MKKKLNKSEVIAEKTTAAKKAKVNIAQLEREAPHMLTKEWETLSVQCVQDVIESRLAEKRNRPASHDDEEDTGASKQRKIKAHSRERLQIDSIAKCGQFHYIVRDRRIRDGLALGACPKQRCSFPAR